MENTTAHTSAIIMSECTLCMGPEEHPEIAFQYRFQMRPVSPETAELHDAQAEPPLGTPAHLHLRGGKPEA
jgi:hypothetical protein